ncbi:maleylacetoacetate isomerase-like isoform X1 [Anneissia japonica]|uniref:maleylacetoacetate isomerase-like isoform X1 n=1 Tax=Anneissia japonica TaxID=1529436 RepID=UPI0014256D63|nr:maleylacetoacetate isomerase-like isoform X1 [Anneissia japonica]
MEWWDSMIEERSAKLQNKLSDEHRELNPSGQVPALLIDGLTLAQSIAIIEYIEETREGTPILPKEPSQRAVVRQVTESITSGIQPIQNLSVLKYVGSEKKMEWGNYHIDLGFQALEKLLTRTAGKYCVGDTVTMADLCLVPQVYNANRFKVDMSKYPIISRIDTSLSELDEFKAAHPSKQPDCPEDLR